MDDHGERWTVSVGGTELAIRAYVEEPSEPTADPPGPVLVIWPALGVPARFYRPFAAVLRERGFGVVLADYRGQGENRPKVGRSDRYGYHEFASVDFPAVTAEVRKRCPGRPVVLLGHSLGGQIGVSYAGRHPGDLAGVILVAAGSPYFRAYPVLLGLRVLLSIQFVHAVASLVGYWPGDRLRFGGRQSRTLLRDWARINRTGRFRFAGNSAYEGSAHSAYTGSGKSAYGGVGNAAYDADLAELKLPVLAVSVEGDVYAPRSAVDHLCGLLRSADITRWHHDARLDHFRWVKDGGPIADRIADWSRQLTGH